MRGTNIKSREWRILQCVRSLGLFMNCERCGIEVDLPFKCNYCEHYYCPEHRLPENHDCAETWRVKALRSARGVMSPTQTGTEARSLLLPPRRQPTRFSPTEIRHLAVGTAIVTAAGISFFLEGPLSFGVIGLVVASALFSLGFIVHELAHKYVAQGYGLWAEFRLNMFGLVLTAISIISPVKFIAPGAVMISGFTDPEKMGRTALAGPVINVLITSALLMVTQPFIGTELYGAVVLGARINAFLALFNLLPFAVFDGQKVYAWNKRYWAVIFTISLLLTVYTSLILQPY